MNKQRIAVMLAQAYLSSPGKARRDVSDAFVRGAVAQNLELIGEALLEARLQLERMKPVYEAAVAYGAMMDQPAREDLTREDYEADDAIVRALCDAVRLTRSVP